MSKQRGFVRYTKAGKIVPGSMILTNGSYPSGPGLWTEVKTDLCCTTVIDNCIEIDVTPDNNDPDRIGDVSIGFNVFSGTTSSQIIVYWGDGAIEGFDMNDSIPFFDKTHKYEIVDQTYTIRVCFSSIKDIMDFQLETLNPYYITEIRGIKKLFALEELDLDYQEFSSIDVSGMNSLLELDLSNNSLLSSVNFGSGLPNLEDLALDVCAFTGSFDATIFPSLRSLNLYNNNLTSVNISGLTDIYLINVANNSNLTSLDISGLVNLIYVFAFGCALNETQVDNILIELDTNGLTDGQVSLNGGTNATPSALGLAAAANLLLKNWTVNYNP